MKLELVVYVPSDGNVSVGDTVEVGSSVKVDSSILWVGKVTLDVCDTYEPIMVGRKYH